MEKYNNWKRKFYAIWAGQAVSLITSAILQMAIIFYLTEKTGSAMVLSNDWCRFNYRSSWCSACYCCILYGATCLDDYDSIVYP